MTPEAEAAHADRASSDSRLDQLRATARAMDDAISESFEADNFCEQLLEMSLTAEEKAILARMPARRQQCRRAAERPKRLVTWLERRLEPAKVVRPAHLPQIRALPRRKRHARRRSAQSVARAGADPPGPRKGERRYTGKWAALERDKDNLSGPQIFQIDEDGNNFGPAVGAAWSGDFTTLAPLVLLLRHRRGRPWRAIEVSAEHAAWLETAGAA